MSNFELFRKTRTSTLLREPFTLGDSEFDKIFITACNPQYERLSSGDGYNFFFNVGTTSTVRLNDKVDVDIPTVTEMMQNKDSCLIAANAFLRLLNADGTLIGYPVLLRDSEAPVYPNHYTVAAGRCDMTPFKTAMAELNQELGIEITRPGSDTVELLGFSDETAAQEGFAYKESKANLRLPKMRILALNWLDGIDTYELGGEKNHKATIILDQATNTYEFCFVAEAILPEGYVIDDCFDGDWFGREVDIVKSLSKLKDKPCVPALKSFIDICGSMF